MAGSAAQETFEAYELASIHCRRQWPRAAELLYPLS